MLEQKITINATPEVILRTVQLYYNYISKTKQPINAHVKEDVATYVFQSQTARRRFEELLNTNQIDFL